MIDLSAPKNKSQLPLPGLSSPRRALGLVFLCLLLAGPLGLGPALSPVAAQEAEESEEWSWVMTPNFKILTNAPDLLGMAIALNLERFRSAFGRLSPGMSLQSPIPVRVVAFRSHQTYAPYKNPPSPRILGQFVRNLDGHYLTFHAGASALFSVDYHEYVHYLVDSNLPSVPRWFNEGLAEYYSTFQGDRETVTVGLPVERHVHWFAGDEAEQNRSLSYEFSLLDVVNGRAAHDGNKVGGFYAFSWALVHYLLSGEGQRLEQTADFLARLGDGEDEADAFEAAFETRMDDLADEVREYVRAGKFKHATFRMPFRGTVPIVRPAKRYEVEIWLGDLAAQIGHLDWARGHYETALGIAPEKAGGYAGLGFLHDIDQRYEEAALFYGDAMERRPLEPRTFLRYGRHLLNRLLPEESDGLVASGHLVAASAFARSSVAWLQDPVEKERLEAAEKAAAGALKAFQTALRYSRGDHAGAKLHIGVGHLFNDVDPDPGIKALHEVRQWLPQDRAVAFYLLQLYLKKKDFTAARRLLTNAIGDAYPELSLQAEEEIDRAYLIHRAGLALDQGEVEEALGFFDEAISVTSDLDLRERMSELLAAFEAEHLSPPPAVYAVAEESPEAGSP